MLARRIRAYYDGVAAAAFRAPGAAAWFESEGEDHGFHLYSPLRATSKRLMGSLVEFINQQPNSSPGNRMVLGVPTTPFKDVFGYGMAMKSWSTRSCMPFSYVYYTK